LSSDPFAASAQSSDRSERKRAAVSGGNSTTSERRRTSGVAMASVSAEQFAQLMSMMAEFVIGDGTGGSRRVKGGGHVWSKGRFEAGETFGSRGKVEGSAVRIQIAVEAQSEKLKRR